MSGSASAVSHLEFLASKLTETWPKVTDKPRDERERVVQTFGEKAGKEVWSLIESGLLLVPVNIFEAAARWANARRWHEVFLLVVQQWLPTVRPGLGGPMMTYPDAHLDLGLNLGPVDKLARTYALAMRALAELSASRCGSG